MSLIRVPSEQRLVYLGSRKMKQPPFLRAVGLSEDEWKDLQRVALPLAQTRLSRDEAFDDQPAGVIPAIVADIQAKLPFLHRYEDAWPASVYIRLHLTDYKRHGGRRQSGRVSNDDGDDGDDSDDGDDGDDDDEGDVADRSPSVSVDGTMDTENRSQYSVRHDNNSVFSFECDYYKQDVEIQIPIDADLYWFLAHECGRDLSIHAENFAKAGVFSMACLDAVIFHYDDGFLEYFVEKRCEALGLTDLETDLFLFACYHRHAAMQD